MARGHLTRAWIIVAAIAIVATQSPARAGTTGDRGPAAAGHYRDHDDANRGGDQGRQEEPGSPRARAPVTFLQINDVYSTIPVDGAGGLARVATLKRQLAAAGRTPFLVLAGDFLSPSVASSVFRGEQMIAALNAAGLDLATLGNHEFDFGDDILIERMHEAKWQWVVSNVVDTRTNQPIGGALPYLVKSFGTLKVGFIGLCLNTSEISRDKLTHTRLLDPIDVAAQYVPRLKADGAAVIVAVTHLSFATDRALVERLPAIDLVIGGHEHFVITSAEHHTLISKAGSDARWVARIDVNVRPEGTVERFYELLPITSAIPDEPATAAIVASFEARLGTELDTVIGITKVPLDATAIRLRSSERNIGNLVADAIRSEAGAEIALVNGGSIRGDRVYPAGPITGRTIVSLQPFDNVICKVRVPGRVVLAALRSGVSKFPAATGAFPQVSGLSFAIDANAPPDRRVVDVRVNGEPLDPEKRYVLAIPDFLFKGGDDYTMFPGGEVLMAPEAGPLVASALAKYVIAKGEIAPAVEGRITVR
ncbi:MAG TPA: bifunctional UDP-sugar hydrolase/5'-nucleotidase [Vicinamibacterales bacterium]|nr:bifunctional UDP-sugar hydrolase/5'-nucleotidase [Vicinamibacterales bacterium]